MSSVVCVSMVLATVVLRSMQQQFKDCLICRNRENEVFARFVSCIQLQVFERVLSCILNFNISRPVSMLETTKNVFLK